MIRKYFFCAFLLFTFCSLTMEEEEIEPNKNLQDKLSLLYGKRIRQSETPILIVNTEKNCDAELIITRSNKEGLEETITGFIPANGKKILSTSDEFQNIKNIKINLATGLLSKIWLFDPKIESGEVNYRELILLNREITWIAAMNSATPIYLKLQILPESKYEQKKWQLFPPDAKK